MGEFTKMDHQDQARGLRFRRRGKRSSCYNSFLSPVQVWVERGALRRSPGREEGKRDLRVSSGKGQGH